MRLSRRTHTIQTNSESSALLTPLKQGPYILANGREVSVTVLASRHGTMELSIVESGVKIELMVRDDLSM